MEVKGQLLDVSNPGIEVMLSVLAVRAFITEPVKPDPSILINSGDRRKRSHIGWTVLLARDSLGDIVPRASGSLLGQLIMSLRVLRNVSGTMQTYFNSRVLRCEDVFGQSEERECGPALASLPRPAPLDSYRGGAKPKLRFLGVGNKLALFFSGSSSLLLEGG